MPRFIELLRFFVYLEPFYGNIIILSQSDNAIYPGRPLG
jgi:hypothetical protein